MSDSFSSGPAPDGRLADARAATADAVRNGATAVSVFGGPSTGKTALCEALATGVDDRSFTATITDPSIDPDAFLLQLLSDFGLTAGTPANGHTHDRQTLSAAVVKFLRSLKPLAAHALVIIDDAEQVGVDVYETVLQLSQAAGSDGHPLRLVLVGQPLLDARLAEPPLSAFPADGRWIRVAADHDSQAEVPVTMSTPSAAPSAAGAPEVATSAPSPRGRTGALALSPRLLALTALLALVAIGAWWATRANAPQSESAAPAVPLAPATPGDAATPPAPATPPATGTPAPTPGATSPAAPAAKPAVASANGSAATAAAPTGSRESYRIVIAAFKTAARAQQVASDLQQQQLATTVRADPTNTWHQVVAGPYPSIDAARQAQRTIERAGFTDTQISLGSPTTNR